MNHPKLILVMAVILMSCVANKNMTADSSNTATNQATILNDIWALEEIQGAAVTVNDFGREIPVLEFHMADGKVMGNSGCNQLSGTYRIDGNEIFFGPMISTKMACMGNGEQRFLEALNKAKMFKIENLKLYLLDGDVETLQFKKVD